MRFFDEYKDRVLELIQVRPVLFRSEIAEQLEGIDATKVGQVILMLERNAKDERDDRIFGIIEEYRAVVKKKRSDKQREIRRHPLTDEQVFKAIKEDPTISEKELEKRFDASFSVIEHRVKSLARKAKDNPKIADVLTMWKKKRE